ncbi:hypothetical protein [Streptomyces sp. AC512_CC834]|uniref:hypothetical protein n=1 Tax=Streptomyces sp. AC512_CC834 TaxID=2823691 RepID=UPI001C267402|nr:hypothetical protein [Streptomyces sp. AC512_CC834]
MPDVAKAQERHEAAVRLRREFRPGKSPADAVAGVQRDAQAEFLESGKWPADFTRRVGKAHTEAVAWEAEALALRGLEDSTKATAEHLRESLSADVLEHLDGRLTEILDTAKSAGDALGGVTSAEQAIEAGADALDAWRSLTSLVSDYSNVRAAQWDVLRAVTLSDEQSRMRTWRAQGHGEIKGVRVDAIPAFVVDGIRSGAYDVEFLVWVAQSDAGYVPTSYDDLEAEVAASTDPVSYDDHGPLIDLSPRVMPERQPRPAQVYTHSSTPHLDASQPAPAKPKANASAPDREPSTTDYF